LVIEVGEEKVPASMDVSLCDHVIVKPEIATRFPLEPTNSAVSWTVELALVEYVEAVTKYLKPVLTIKVNVWVSELVAFVAVIVKFVVPVAVGVPASVPVEVSKVRPAGRVEIE